MTINQVFIFSILFLLITGCTVVPSNTQQPEQPILIETIARQVQSSSTATAPNPEPPTATSTATRRPTRTPWPTHTASVTSLPALPETTARAILQDLYDTNGGCRLPCWWGIVPGETRWDAVKKTLEPLTVVIYDSWPEGNPRSIEVLTPPEAESLNSTLRHQVYSVQDGVVYEMKLDILNISPYAYIDKMVQAYGSPDEIWIFLSYFNNIPEMGVLFWLMMFYQEQGIMVKYDPFSTKIADGKITACSGFGGLDLYLWDPVEDLPFEERLNQYEVIDEWMKFMPLEVATGISVEDFTAALLREDEPTCVTTPVELWVH